MSVTTNKVRDWLEIVGLFGVIASLVFVGLQLKQDREIAVAAAYQGRAGIAVEGLAALAANETSMRALTKARYGDPASVVEMENFAAPLTAIEMQTAMLSLNSMMNLMDNSYYQYQAGFLPEGHWLAVRSLILGLAANPLWRSGLEQRPNNYRPEFNDMLDEILLEVDAESGTREIEPGVGRDDAQ